LSADRLDYLIRTAINQALNQPEQYEIGVELQTYRNMALKLECALHQQIKLREELDKKLML